MALRSEVLTGKSPQEVGTRRLTSPPQVAPDQAMAHIESEGYDPGPDRPVSRRKRRRGLGRE